MTKEISISCENKVNYQNIKYIDIIDEHLFIKLGDNSCFLTNGIKTIKINPNYEHIKKLIIYDNTYYGLIDNQIINLNTDEVLLTDSSIYNIYKEDDETILVIRIEKPNALFSLITKKYLPAPDNYEFERNLDNHLYSFCEKNYDKNPNDLQRVIINSTGKVLFENIENGHIQNYNNNIIFINDNRIIIQNIQNLDERVTVPNNDATKYYNGNIYIIKNNQIIILDSNLNEVKIIPVPDLDKVYDWEVTGGIIKLQLPTIINGCDFYKFVYINIANERMIQHNHIEALPYYTPEFYIGFDSLKDDEYNDLKIQKPNEENTYYFYDKDFNKIMEIKGDEYEDFNDGKFIIHRYTENEWKKIFVNLHEGIIKECPYDGVHFDKIAQIGHGYNKNTDMIDIFDENLCPLFTNINYKDYNINKHVVDITYRIVNKILIFQIQHNRRVLRNIIFDENKNILLNSDHHACKPIGNLIQIREYNDDENDSIYLNTLTGEMGTLSINQENDIPKLIMNNQKNILSNPE